MYIYVQLKLAAVGAIVASYTNADEYMEYARQNWINEAVKFSAYLTLIACPKFSKLLKAAKANIIPGRLNIV